VPTRASLPLGYGGAPFRVAAARGEGVSWGGLRRLPNPFHGVRSATAPTDLLDRAAALQTVFRAADCFSHLTAAALIGLRLPEGTRDPGLHVTTLGGGRAMRRPGIIGHVARAGRGLALSSAALVVTDPVETWTDLAASLTVDELVAMGDGLLARRGPLTTLAELERAASTGRPGAGRLRAALEWMRPGTDSWRETMLRLALVRRGVPEPEVNGVIIDDRGTVIAHGDLVWREQRLIVEYEGREHWADARQFRIDIGRINRIGAHGWRHHRVDKHLLAAPDRLAHDVLTLLSATIRA